ncbi:MAG: hypothetical protein H6735_01445 [Alphaproteobacteria bacterium]|nr:hypothetical protein [Alphaproteobacteria bacterium]
MRVLVTGFGPFPGVPDNPSGRLARSVDGARLGGALVTGIELPVHWTEGPEGAVRVARELDAALVVGLGVAVGRAGVHVERRAVRVEVGRPDARGDVVARLSGPPEVRATLDTRRLAHALGARLSDDAGRYVCNAWLYRVASALEVPVGFVHLPAEGLARHRLLSGLRAMLGGAP